MSIRAHFYDDVKLRMMIDPLASDPVWIVDGLMDGLSLMPMTRGDYLAIIGGRRTLRQ